MRRCRRAEGHLADDLEGGAAMKTWAYEVWHWRGRWIRGTLEASTTAAAVSRALAQAYPEYRSKLPRKGLKVTVNVTRID
ncbi:MAG: hypothetical protein U1B30_15890 [Pseudomonadota bacterium]|nr:hypothetical protein [Pseudomonadota bacterium]